ncbi:MAG TPA: hypothetical protein DDX19_12785 [Rhodopirellula baltica]|nr:hypothetical protein [Rhodopirellula baltica]
MDCPYQDDKNDSLGSVGCCGLPSVPGNETGKIRKGRLLTTAPFISFEFSETNRGRRLVIVRQRLGLAV